MNWSRAMTALIVAFLVLDSVLGFKVWEQARGAVAGYGAVTSADLRNLRLRLEADGVRLACSLPQRPPPLPYLVLRPGSARAREVAGRLSSADDDGAESLATLLDNGTVIFTRNVGREGPALSRNTAIRRARSFVEDYVGDASGLTMDYALQAGDCWVVNFCARIDEMPLFSARVTLKVFPRGVGEARFAWFEPVGYSSQRVSIIPSTEAALTASSSLGPLARGRSIVDMALGYYSEPYDARQWESVPVWRVLFDDGREVFVNAHAGEVERPRGVGR